MDPTPFIQGGSFGLVAYTLFWLTKKINGKMDRLAEAVEKSTQAMTRLSEHQEKLLERLDS